jgi:hypothetical protein
LPSKVFNRDELFKGALFKGDKGYLLCDYDYRILMPTKADMTQYTAPKSEKDLIPKSPGHHAEWIIGAKTGKPTLCNFDYSGALVESNMLALAAYRVGKAFQYDPKSGKVTNCSEAEQYLTRPYREGWVLDG